VKEKMASALFTLLLATILILLVIVNIFVFVSGPLRKMEADDENLFRSVVSSYQLTDAVFLNRHVHDQITYVAFVGSEQGKLIFYDETGLVFLLIDRPVRPGMLIDLLTDGSISEADIYFGFFQTPVFVIDNEERLQYINFSGETVFFLKKGD
jgi:hypothetical protein